MAKFRSNFKFKSHTYLVSTAQHQSGSQMFSILSAPSFSSMISELECAIQLAVARTNIVVSKIQHTRHELLVIHRINPATGDTKILLVGNDLVTHLGRSSAHQNTARPFRVYTPTEKVVDFIHSPGTVSSLALVAKCILIQRSGLLITLRLYERALYGYA